jgi:hypothetical protein
MRGVKGGSLLLAAVLGLGAWEPARPEIYKCVGADGKTLFTSDPSQCPGADRHEPTGQFEKVPTQSRPSVRNPPARLRGRGTASPAGNEALWRGKKLRAEAQLRDLEGRLEYVRRAVVWCNRGHALYTEDETGIRRGYDCRNVHDAFEETEARLGELRVYLDEGLEEECRRAGCLPGWVR